MIKFKCSSCGKELQLEAKIYDKAYKDQVHCLSCRSENHGGKREGAGRKSLGTSKKVSVTLPDKEWENIEKICKLEKISKSEFFRRCYATTMNALVPLYDDSWNKK